GSSGGGATVPRLRQARWGDHSIGRYGAPLGYDSREAPRLLALGFARGPLCRTARIGSSGSGGFGSGGGSGSGPGIGGVGCGVGSGGGNGLGSGDMHAVSPRGGS